MSFKLLVIETEAVQARMILNSKKWENSYQN